VILLHLRSYGRPPTDDVAERRRKDSFLELHVLREGGEQGTPRMRPASAVSVAPNTMPPVAMLIVKQR
jgi:hypothetical protein